MCSGTSVKQIQPLEGIKVIELEGYAPVPHCGLMLSDFGAKVTVISKVGRFSLKLLQYL